MKFLKILFFILLFLNISSCDFTISKIAGDFYGQPKDMQSHLSPKAKELINSAMNGLHKECVRDVHVHIAGIGPESETIEETKNPWVNPKAKSLFNFKSFIKLKIYLNAAGISHPDLDHPDKVNSEYLQRIIDQWKDGAMPGKAHLLAFDKTYSQSGKPEPLNTTFYMPNQYIVDVARKNPDIFVPVISVHPYRHDAISELEKWAKEGVKFIKWLPNSMHIDASLPRLDEYYKKVKELDMVILTHVGEERAVEGSEYQKLGNPLLFRRPLDMGVKIVMAHVASLGECSDTELGGEKPCFDLFWRLFNEEKYKKNLFGEISAITIHTRLGVPLLTLLEHPEMHSRLVNGSDYPLPAINWIYRTSQWKDQGFITDDERLSLNEIYHYNPLLFDLVTKRILKHPISKNKFSDNVFYLPKELGGNCF